MIEERPPRAHPVAYVDDLDQPRLDDADSHHFRRVLRLRSGDDITVSDGRGAWRPARLEPDGVTVTAPPRIEPSNPRPVVVGIALIKALDVAVQKLTEVGVDTIHLLVCERNVVRWRRPDVERKMRRLQAIIREAGTQSRRARLPVVHPPSPTVEVLAYLPGAAIADLAGDRDPASVSAVLIGPEGGWTTAEVDLAEGAVDLGPHVLRAETAAIVAATLLVHHRR